MPCTRKMNMQSYLKKEKRNMPQIGASRIMYDRIESPTVAMNKASTAPCCWKRAASGQALQRNSSQTNSTQGGRCLRHNEIQLSAILISIIASISSVHICNFVTIEASQSKCVCIGRRYLFQLLCMSGPQHISAFPCSPFFL